MAKTLDELDAEFGAPAQSAAPQGGSWDELDNEILKSVKGSQAPASSGPTAAPKQSDADFAGSTLRIGPLDTRIPLPASVNRGLAQIGSGLADWGLGYKQMTGQAGEGEADEKRRVDAPLLDGVLGKVNNFVGKMAPGMAVPFGYAPAALKAGAPILEGVVGGALQGAFEPVGTGESRGANVGLASAAGAAIPAAIAGARRLSTPGDPKTQALIRAAEKEGIPLGIADTSASKLVKGFRSIANDLPITGSANASVRESQQEAFNRAMGQRWGSNANKHTPAVREADKARIVGELDKVWSSNDLPYDANLFGSFRQLEQKASLMPKNEGDAVLRNIKDIEDKVIAKPNGDLYLPGQLTNSLQKDLFKKFGKSNDERGSVMMELRQTLIDNFNANVTGPEAAALNKARGQYRAFKSQENALQKADVGVAGRQVGDIRPVDASAGVLQAYKRSPGASPFGDLPQIGQQFLRDTTPQTGGSIRAAIQNSALGGGALLGAGFLGSPVAAAGAAGATIGLNKALTSPAIRKLMQNPTVTRSLLDNPNTAAATKEALANAVRRAPAVGLMGALSSSPASAEEE